MADWISSLATMFRIEAGAAELGSWRRWIALMVSPLCYFLLLAVGMASAVGGGAEYLRFVLPGVAAMQASSGLNRVVARLVAERRWGLAALKLHSGVPGSAYLLGSFAPHLLIVAAQAGVLGLVAAALGAARLVEIPLLVLLSLPAALFWTGFGYCLTAVIKSYQTRDLVLSVRLLRRSGVLRPGRGTHRPAGPGDGQPDDLPRGAGPGRSGRAGRADDGGRGGRLPRRGARCLPVLHAAHAHPVLRGLSAG